MWGEDDTRFAYRVTRRLVDAIREIDAAFASDSNKFPTLRPAYELAHRELQGAALRIFTAAVEAAAALQATLMSSARLSAAPDVPLHAISGASRAMALMWRSVGELGYSRVARYFESLKLSVGRQLIQLYADGAATAAEMLGGGEEGEGDEGAAVGLWGGGGGRFVCVRFIARLSSWLVLFNLHTPHTLALHALTHQPNPTKPNQPIPTEQAATRKSTSTPTPPPSGPPPPPPPAPTAPRPPATPPSWRTAGCPHY